MTDNDSPTDPRDAQIPKLMEVIWNAAIGFYDGRAGPDDQETILMAMANIAGSIIAIHSNSDAAIDGFIEVVRLVHEQPTMGIHDLGRQDN